MPDEAVLLLGFGGPTSFEEVRPFVLNVTRGRFVPQERIEAVVQQYRLIGGKSPFNELTRRQADALEAALSKRQLPIPVHLGMLYWTPYIADTIAGLAAEDVSRVVAIIMAPHRTEASFDRYLQALDEALIALGEVKLKVDIAPQWHTHPFFVQAIADRVREKLDLLPEKDRSQALIVYTAHSVPTAMSERSDYAGQIRGTAALVSAALAHQSWCVAYQSRSGSPHQPWLEPDIRDAIADAGKKAIGNIVVVPIGFVCDHAEVLFDLDVQAAEIARERGVNMLRAETVGDHPKFIEMLADLIHTRVGA